MRLAISGCTPLWAALTLGLGVVPFACSSPEALKGEGGQCLQVTDCQAGLVCVPQTNGPKICSVNVKSIVSTEEGGASMDAPAGEAGEGGARGDGMTGSRTDTGTVTPADTGAAGQETGAAGDSSGG